MDSNDLMVVWSGGNVVVPMLFKSQSQVILNGGRISRPQKQLGRRFGGSGSDQFSRIDALLLSYC